MIYLNNTEFEKAESTEFVRVMNSYIDVVEAFCKYHANGFDTYDEVCSAIEQYHNVEKVQVHRIFENFREVGLLWKNDEHWEVPLFLIDFIREIKGHKELTTHYVVKAWTDELKQYSEQLERQLSLSLLDNDRISRTLRSLDGVFLKINGSLLRNRISIAQTVEEYTSVKNKVDLRSRYRHLNELYNEFVKPILTILQDSAFKNACRSVNRLSSQIESTQDHQSQLFYQAKTLKLNIRKTESTAITETKKSFHELQRLLQKLESESRVLLGIENFKKAFRERRENLETYISERISTPTKFSINLPTSELIKQTLLSRKDFVERPPSLKEHSFIEESPTISKVELVEKLTQLTHGTECLFNFILEAYPEQSLDICIQTFFDLLSHSVYQKNIQAVGDKKLYQKDNIEFMLEQQRWIND